MVCETDRKPSGLCLISLAGGRAGVAGGSLTNPAREETYGQDRSGRDDRWAECIGEKETVEQAAKRLADLNVGAMICGENDRLKGMLTDRDIVIKVIAPGKDPAQTTAGELATQDDVITNGADDSVDEALDTMTKNKVRRLPVIDGHKLIGVITQADLAQAIDPASVSSSKPSPRGPNPTIPPGNGSARGHGQSGCRRDDGGAGVVVISLYR